MEQLPRSNPPRPATVRSLTSSVAPSARPGFAVCRQGMQLPARPFIDLHPVRSSLPLPGAVPLYNRQFNRSLLKNFRAKSPLILRGFYRFMGIFTEFPTCIQEKHGAKLASIDIFH
ncbi:hypothetical protein [Burkholderia sp. WAC0059]|uniref:hypothetical protein n=1 Tax=Burkholderia sp. WAC0059 TaxID=2066022 RepID=UPI0011AECD36|nr:hypothetical protein [Burkholderia sp. WAC0059]